MVKVKGVFVINLAEKYGINPEKLERALSLIRERKIVFYAMSGKMGAGKDTIGDGIESKLKSKGEKVISMSYSLPMRKEMQDVVNFYNSTGSHKITARHFNVSEQEVEKYLSILNGGNIYERTDEARLAVQYWGTDVRRKQNVNYWIDQLIKMVVEEVCKLNHIKISDVRFPNEADSILDLGGKIIRIELPDEVRVSRILKRDNLVPTKAHLEHSSETALDNYLFDRVFDGEKSIDSLVDESLNYILGEI